MEHTMMANRLNPHVLDDAKTRWGLSDARLAAKLGISPDTLRKTRNGDREPSLTEMLVLRKLTGWPLDGLVIENAASAAA